MYLEVVSPEAVLFASEVDSISVPGTDGAFQILVNHAPIVSTLREGVVKIHLNPEDLSSQKDSLHKKIVPQRFHREISIFDVTRPLITLESNHNHVSLGENCTMLVVLMYRNFSVWSRNSTSVLKGLSIGLSCHFYAS